MRTRVFRVRPNGMFHGKIEDEFVIKIRDENARRINGTFDAIIHYGASERSSTS